MSFVLRPYQQAAARFVWDQWSRTSDPALLVLPTGAGKTQVFSALASKLIEIDPTARVVVLAHRAELIRQAEARLKSCVSAPVGVWCGSLNRKEADQVMVATIQSLEDFPHEVDCLIVDEAHNISHDEETGYRRLLAKLPAHARVLGVTATPFRLSGGKITGEGHIFPQITYRVDMLELIEAGHLVRPRLAAAPEDCQIDTDGLKMTAGDFNQKQLDERVSSLDLLDRQIYDALPRLAGRNSIVWFCVNINHAEALHERLGPDAGVVHSKMPQKARDHILNLFGQGSLRHLVNVSVLTEGWDCPRTDGIVLLRPTASPVFYVQSCGRGLRPYEGKKDCLILDYAQVVENLGPLNDPRVKSKKKGEEIGIAPMKICPKCSEYVAAAVRLCPECGHEFPPPAEKAHGKPEAKAKILKTDDPEESQVTDLDVERYTAKSGRECLKITYYHGYSDKTLEFLTFDAAFARSKARVALAQLGVSDVASIETINDAISKAEEIRVPTQIIWRWENDKYKRIESRRLDEASPRLVDQLTTEECKHCKKRGPHEIWGHIGNAYLICPDCFGWVSHISDVFLPVEEGSVNHAA